MDHGILSPSGKVSRRAERAAKERIRKELLPKGIPGPQEIQISEKEYLLRRATELRMWADRGFRPRKHRKEADSLELEANKL